MKNNRKTAGILSEEAYNRIREKILRGELAIGAAISRRRLAQEFGMSFLPVSEAIRRLQDDGLVESQPRVGTRVKVPSARDVRERGIMREALETQAARLFAEKASTVERSELRSMAAHLDAMALAAYNGKADTEALFRVQAYHLALHTRIAECSGCGALCDALNRNQLLIFNWLYDTAARYRISPGSHEQLVNAVCGTDVDAAEAAMRQHVRYGMEEIQAEIAARFIPVTEPFRALEQGRARRGSPSAWRVKSTDT